MVMDTTRLKHHVDTFWNDAILPSITEYIRIPNKSPAFDSKWVEHGYMEDAVRLMEAWAREQLGAFPSATLEVVRLPGRTPLIFMEIPSDHGGDGKDTVLLYGHLDKQPEMVGWTEGMGPWTPVQRDDKLYGRGGADDGYAMFAAISALLALKEQNLPHARAVIVIEVCEESGSPDLPFYIDHLADRIGTPDLVVCLDSGCGNYDQLWLTTSLRGMVIGNLTVKVLTEGVHSGDASGMVASSFRIARQLLSRIEDEATGQMRLDDLFVQIPPDRSQQAKDAAAILGDEVYTKFPFAPGVKPMAGDNAELILNRTWRPQLAITAVDGYPTPGDAGNVLLPYSTAKLSLRTPPTLDAGEAARKVKQVLEADPPYGAEVAFDGGEGQSGWHAPPLAPWPMSGWAEASTRAWPQTGTRPKPSGAGKKSQ